MAAGETIQLDYLDLGGDATPHEMFQDDIAMTTPSRAFIPFPAQPPKDDPEVSTAFKRLDLVEARLGRIEKRLMEISLLIARNFNATLQTPIGIPDALDLATSSPAGPAEPVAEAWSAVQAPTVPSQTRGKRDRDLDDALETFLNSLGPTQTRQ